MRSALVGLLVTGLATVCSAAKVSAAADPALRLDLTRVASVIVYHPTLLAADGYFVTYRLDVPGEQYVELTRAAQRAEFEVIEVWVDTSGVREVWITKEGDPTALTIFRVAGGVIGSWHLAGPRTPPVPPEAEVRRRFSVAAELFGKTQQGLGLAGFKGGDAGTITLNLAGAENLFLESRGASVTYDYRLYALNTYDLSEELKAEETSEGELILELGRDRIRVVRQTGPAAARVRTELLAEGQGWEADEQSAGGRRTLARSEAEVLLRGALEVLSAARQHFGIGFGRDLSTVRLP